ncbi:MAG: class I SAM-dependent methyltransferase [Clostridia bacterium]|nr:class I SAM-dependent methyltransferase [Clostridia bacterium]
MREFTCIEHYDALITENNDPILDAEPLRRYMDKWDGQPFLDMLRLNRNDTVLEIGVGTGRLALRIAPYCSQYTGIDLSCKTIERGRENLSALKNAKLICGDFLFHTFKETFDVIYSSLTFMHIEHKAAAIEKIFRLLNTNGRFILSIDKSQDTLLKYAERCVKIFPDTKENIMDVLLKTGFVIEKQSETEFAHLFAAKKP